jgi:hypothetical protein
VRHVGHLPRTIIASSSEEKVKGKQFLVEGTAEKLCRCSRTFFRSKYGNKLLFMRENVLPFITVVKAISIFLFLKSLLSCAIRVIVIIVDIVILLLLVLHLLSYYYTAICTVCLLSTVVAV